MKEKGKKRGRPILITPWIDGLVAQYVMAEKQKPTEERRQRKVLAGDIQEKIKRQIEEKGVQERVPGLSAIEKRITEHYKHDSPEDKPWTIFTLDDIPPEALPTVLKQYREVKDFCGLSIREAKWIARLSAIDPPERWPWLYALIASIEQLFEMVGNPPSFHLIDDILAASVANDREAENEALDQCIAWFGGEVARRWAEELKQKKARQRRKVNNE